MDPDSRPAGQWLESKLKKAAGADFKIVGERRRSHTSESLVTVLRCWSSICLGALRAGRGMKVRHVR
jgi:hypothetical protein